MATNKLSTATACLERPTQEIDCEPWSAKCEVWRRWLSHHRPQWQIHSLSASDGLAHRKLRGYLATPDYQTWQPCFWSFRYEHPQRLFLIDEEESRKYLKTVEREVLAAQSAPWWAQFTYPRYRSSSYDLACLLAHLSGKPLTQYAEHPSWQSHPLYMDYCTAGPRWYYADPDTGEIIPPVIGGAGSTYWVATASGGGSNANPGTQAQPKLTLWGSTGGCNLLAQNTGDMLIIKAGVYGDTNDHINSDNPAGQLLRGGTQLSPNVIRADTGATVTVNPVATHVVDMRDVKNWITFQDITFDAINTTANLQGQCIQHYRQDGLLTNGLVFTRCIIKNGRDVGLHTDHAGANSQVIDCVFENNNRGQPNNNAYLGTSDGLVRGCDSHFVPSDFSSGSQGGAGGIRSASNQGDDYQTNNCVLERCLCYGLPHGILLGSGTNNLARNNIIHTGGGLSYGLWVWASKPTSNTKVYNNTLFNHPTALAVDQGGSAPAIGTIFKNNIIHTATTGIRNTGSGTILDHTVMFQVTTQISNSGTITPTNTTITNPLFVNTSINDFRLQAGSPAIDAGVNLSPDVTNDYLGVSRPQGAAYDVGAYESMSTVDTTPPLIPTGLSVI